MENFDAFNFFSTIYKHCKGQVEIRCLPSRRQIYLSVKKARAYDYGALAETDNVYFGVATRDGKGGGKANIIEIPAVWVDIDFKTTPRAEADRLLAQFPLKPTVIVLSGGGYHIYCRLKQPVGKGGIPQVEAINRALAKVLKGDPGSVEAAHILRVPSTLNRKYTPPQPVTIKDDHRALEYDLSDFDPFLQLEEEAPPPQPEKTEHEAEGRPGDDYNKRVLVNDIAALLVKHGYQPDKPSGDKQRFTRPGKDAEDGISGTLFSASRLYYNFSSKDPYFEQFKSYTPFALFAILEHGGEFGAAAAELRRQGYGKQEAGKRKVVHLTPPKPVDPCLFPDVYGGLAGAFTSLYSKYLEVPPPFLFMSFLTCLGNITATKLKVDSELRTQPRLYTVLLGASADDRKSSAIDHTRRFFIEALGAEAFSLADGVGSAEGLQKLLRDRRHLLLCLDEFKSFVNKCRIDGSVLLPCVNTLFESNRYQSETKTHSISLEDAHLSLLAASTVDTYQACWTSQFTDIGFGNRLFLVVGSGTRRFALPKTIPEVDKQPLRQWLRRIVSVVGDGRTLGITTDADAAFQAWYMKADRSIHAKRIEGYALRLMLLFCANEERERIDIDVVNRVLRLCDWQVKVRQLHDPIDADNAVARMEANIQKQLAARGSLLDSALRKFVNAAKAGMFIYQTALRNLQSNALVARDNYRGKVVWSLNMDEIATTGFDVML